ncbi:hypothetical protein Taro_045710 [Colocasia esculenta]|uniref:Uncharacterized protein n=1 Tax=Colocasia esculenta TaxID=4460 RepID=A0A843WMW3_COLES|nr:hypothetical protein [Colocasia esculenta]
MFSGCDGYREANVVCVWYVCVFQGLIGLIVLACSTPVSSACHRDRKECRVLTATEVAGAFLLPLCGTDRLHVRHVSRAGRPADVSLGKATPRSVAIMSRRDDTSRFQPLGVFKKPQSDRTAVSSARPGEGELWRFLRESMLSACSCRGKLAWGERNARGAWYHVFFARRPIGPSRSEGDTGPCRDHSRVI